MTTPTAPPSTTPAGTFVWYDLLTTDPAAAIAFYGHVLGWTSEPFAGSPTSYATFASDQGALGGAMLLPDEARKRGAPAHWLGSVAVADADATMARVRELGGQGEVEPRDIPGVGRFAVIAGSQGARLAVLAPSRPMAAQDGDRSGAFDWAELMCADHRAAFRFYGELFGWEKLGAHDLGAALGEYLLFGRGGQGFGGMMTRCEEMTGSAWLYYVTVGDLDAALARVVAAGGQVTAGPSPLPNGKRYAQIMDPQGARLALRGP